MDHNSPHTRICVKAGLQPLQAERVAVAAMVRDSGDKKPEAAFFGAGFIGEILRKQGA